MRRVLFAVAVLSGSFLTGCGGSSTGPSNATPTPPPPSKSAIVVVVSPNPVAAEVNIDADPGLPWLVRYSVTVAETAGLACNVNRFIVSFRTVGGVEFANVTYTGADFGQFPGAFIGAKETKTFPLGYKYQSPSGGKEVLIVLTAEVIDANNNTVTAGTEVTVVHHGAPVAER
jgi:hypothetical protein